MFETGDDEITFWKQELSDSRRKMARFFIWSKKTKTVKRVVGGGRGRRRREIVVEESITINDFISM